jgi:hypothetical protein
MVTVYEKKMKGKEGNIKGKRRRKRNPRKNRSKS